MWMIRRPNEQSLLVIISVAQECFKFLIKHDPPWSLTDLKLYTLWMTEAIEFIYFGLIIVEPVPLKQSPL